MISSGYPRSSYASSVPDMSKMTIYFTLNESTMLETFRPLRDETTRQRDTRAQHNSRLLRCSEWGHFGTISPPRSNWRRREQEYINTASCSPSPPAHRCAQPCAASPTHQKTSLRKRIPPHFDDIRAALFTCSSCLDVCAGRRAVRHALLQIRQHLRDLIRKQ